MRTTFLAIAFSLSLPTGAAMAEMPRYDVEGHCTEIAGFGGTYSHSLFNGCIEQEQSAYNALKGAWGTLPPEIKSHCDKIAQFGGAGSYSLLKGCVQMEYSADREKKMFRY